MDDITENFVTECLLKVQTFFESICGKSQIESGIMDVWIKLQKILFTYEMQCINTKQLFVRKLHDVFVKYRSAGTVQL